MSKRSVRTWGLWHRYTVEIKGPRYIPTVLGDNPWRLELRSCIHLKRLWWTKDSLLHQLPIARAPLKLFMVKSKPRSLYSSIWNQLIFSLSYSRLCNIYFNLKRTTKTVSYCNLFEMRKKRIRPLVYFAAVIQRLFCATFSLDYIELKIRRIDLNIWALMCGEISCRGFHLHLKFDIVWTTKH